LAHLPFHIYSANAAVKENRASERQRVPLRRDAGNLAAFLYLSASGRHAAHFAQPSSARFSKVLPDFLAVLSSCSRTPEDPDTIPADGAGAAPPDFRFTAADTF
jgi:hypothetical protein